MDFLPSLSWKELNCFKERQFPLGSQSVWYERSLFRAGSEVWALVREARARNAGVVLPRYFELVASSIELELTLKLCSRTPLRFFHLHYSDKKPEGVVWDLKEVLLDARTREAVWAPVDRQVHDCLIAAWHSANTAPHKLP